MAGPLAGSRDTLIHGRVDHYSHLSSQSRKLGQVVEVSAISESQARSLTATAVSGFQMGCPEANKCSWQHRGNKKGRSSQSGPWRSPPGRREKSCLPRTRFAAANHIDGGAELAAGCCWPSVVFVIRRMSTRRLAARPSRVLLSSTGLSLPKPIK